MADLLLGAILTDTALCPLLTSQDTCLEHGAGAELGKGAVVRRARALLHVSGHVGAVLEGLHQHLRAQVA